MQKIKQNFIVREKLRTICIAHAKMKKTAFTMQKLKKELNSQCKKHKEFALPMQKLKIICIVHANNKKDLHSQGQNYK